MANQTAGEWLEVQSAALKYITENRKKLAALAEARCPHDGRLLAAIYPVGGSSWEWRVGEHLTREQVVRERLAMAAMEYEALVESGTHPEEAWEGTLGLASAHDLGDRVPTSPPTVTGPYTVSPREHDPVELARLRDDLPRGDFASCVKCRRTFMIQTPVMIYAAGYGLMRRSGKPIIVHPGRMNPVRPGERVPEGVQVYGFEPPWYPSPWRIIGLPDE
ncbi:hypothetical protein QFZ56_005232 [Streptomyces achromogenes]|uniref:Uncharacterized protein n=1 Tax=Streptomyces achromogenes TaxID=67255 RepID=A0ABU0Q6H4_STRAH|nr:hypothetical protein [Streptomyces achromogenes]MDQ0686269.1 hypothetical protein [Streptomyces achromogenes]